MHNFRLIIAITDDLTDKEVNVLRSKMALRMRQSEVSGRFFEQVILKRNTDPFDVMQKVYGNSGPKTIDVFRKLCERFLEVVNEVIVSWEVIQANRNLYADVFYYRKLVRYRLEIYQAYALKQVAMEIKVKELTYLELLCRKYEYYEELLLVLKLQWMNASADADYKKVQLLSAELNVVMDFLRNKNIADSILIQYVNFAQPTAIAGISRLTELSDALNRIQALYAMTPSASILYIQMMLKFQLEYCRELFPEAEKTMLGVIKMTGEQESVRYFSRIASNYIALANTQFFLGKFKEAYASSLKAGGRQDEPETSIKVWWESSVFALIYLKKYTEADKLMGEFLDSGAQVGRPDTEAKQQLLRAYIKFLLGDYKSSFVALQHTRGVESDREGWNLGVRFLHIFLTLSTDKIDLADQRIGSMRKHIERTSKLRDLRKRDVVICRILSHLSRSGFDFKETWEDRQKDFLLLRNGEGEYRWRPCSHELIIFDQWFEAKVFGKHYDPEFPKPVYARQADGIRVNG